MQNDVLGAFSDEDASRLSAVSMSQLRHWDRTGLLEASYAPENRHQAYSRVYSFRDLVSLRVLNILRNKHKVSLQHLRDVSKKLAHLGESKWTSTTLYVLGRRVVFDDPSSSERKEVVSGQRVFDIPLSAAISDTREAILSDNKRKSGEFGKIEHARFLQNNRNVFAGTRVPVSAIKAYLERNYTTQEILKEYPDLTAKDIEAVRDNHGSAAA